MRKRTVSVKKTLLHLTILTGFVGCSFGVIDLGPFSLFPYRLLLPILGVLFLLAIFINHGKVSLSHIKIKPYIWFLMLWFFYAVLSLAWAASPVNAVIEIITLFMGMLTIFFTVFYFTDIDDLKLFYNLWLLVLVASIGIGMWNYFTGQMLNPHWIIIEVNGRFAPTALYAFPNIFAVFLSFSIPFILTFVKYHNKLIARFLGMGVLVLALHLLIATGTRAVFFGVFLSLTFWFLFLLKLKVKFKALAMAGFIILLLFAFFPQYVQDPIRKVDAEIASLVAEWGIPGTSIYWRFNMIRNSFVFLIRSWGFGVGAGNVEYHMAHFSVYDVGGNPYVHNWWMQILANYGIFIFAAYIAFYIILIVNLYRTHGKLVDNAEKMICEALLMGLIAFPLAGLATGTIMDFVPQWIFFAFALVFLNYYRVKQKTVSSHAAIVRSGD